MPKNVKHDPPLKCDRCGYTSPYATALGYHKRKAHNILGKSHAAVSIRRKKAAVVVDGPAERADKRVNQKIKALESGEPVLAGPLKKGIPEYRQPHRCPQCKFIGSDKAAATRHLRVVHGAASDPAGSIPCPVCTKPCHGQMGYKQHLKRSHPDYNPGSPPSPKPDKLALRSNGHRASRAELHSHPGFQPNEVLHARYQSQDVNAATAPHLLYLAGYTAAITDNYASRHAISSDTLTRGLAEFLSAQTHR